MYMYELVYLFYVIYAYILVKHFPKEQIFITVLTCQCNSLQILYRKHVFVLKFQKKWNMKLDVKSELFQNMNGAQGNTNNEFPLN